MVREGEVMVGEKAGRENDRERENVVVVAVTPSQPP